ncbi:MAG TPA: Yip1 family protein [Verrucomicrobiae bacterium]|nr:Yip1 family protein [Verrucomicrobiae bacterium]
MIKVFFLSLEPAVTWVEIARAKRSLAAVLFGHLLPLVAVSVAGETIGRIYLEKPHATVEMAKASRDLLIQYGVLQFLFSFLVVFAGSQLVKAVAETFHARHNYTQCFTAVAYGLSPLFLARLLNVVPGMNPWVGFVIGITLSVATLYHGIPCVLQPDPPNAFGLFLTSGLLLGMVSGLAQLIALLLLQGRIHLL